MTTLLVRPEAMKPVPSVFPKTWNVPIVLQSRLGREAGSQRSIVEDEHLLIILHQVPGPHEQTRKAALFWRQPEGEWRSTLGGPGLTDLQKVLKAYTEKLNDLEKAEHEAASATEYHTVLEQLAPVVRASRGLHRALQQAREFLKTERDLIIYRDEAVAIERTAELLLQDAQFGLNFTMAKEAEAQAAAARKMASTAHRLNVLAALFLPLTALASLFGMEIHPNIGDNPTNFYLICGVGILMGVGLSALVSHRG